MGVLVTICWLSVAGGLGGYLDLRMLGGGRVLVDGARRGGGVECDS